MNKYFRLVFTLIASKFRPKINFDSDCATTFRVYPNDLDVLRHMNNGVYFSLQDLARIDLMIRCGIKSVLDKHGWYPVVTGETLKFRRSLKLFQKFQIHSQVIGWTEKHFVVRHRHMSGGEEYASGLIAARFLKRSGGKVTPEELMRTAGLPTKSPVMPEDVLAVLNNL